MANAVKFSQRAVSEAANGSKEAARAIASLGLNAAALREMSPEAAFEAIGGAISRLGPAADKTAVAMKLLGRSGIDILPAFENGVEGFRALRKEADDLGQTLDTLSAEKAAAANDAIDRLTLAFKAMGREIAITAAPAVENLATRITEALTDGNLRRDFRQAWKDAATAPPEVENEFKRIFYDAVDPDAGKAAALQYWAGFVAEAKKFDVEGLFPRQQQPLFPGMMPGSGGPSAVTEAAARARALDDILNGLKDTTAATDGLTESERRYFQALEASLQLAQSRQSESDHQDWLVGQLMPTDDQAAQDAADALERHYAAVQKAADEYERLKRESQITWQLMAEGINQVADQLSNNLAAAITGARVKLLDLASLAETILSMAFRYAITAGLNAVFPGAGVVAGGAMGGPGSGVDGMPMGGKSMAAIPMRDSGAKGTTIVQNITVTGKIDPNDKLSVRRLATVLYDETLKIQKFHGPRGATA